MINKSKSGKTKKKKKRGRDKPEVIRNGAGNPHLSSGTFIKLLQSAKQLAFNGRRFPVNLSPVNIMVIIPVGVGILVGFFLISLLMKYLLKKHETPTYFAILGFIIGSIVPIYYIAITESKTPINLDLPNIIFSFSALIIGVIITYLIERLAIKTKGE